LNEQYQTLGRSFDYYKEGHSAVATYAFKKLEKSKAQKEAENKKNEKTKDKDKDKDKGKTDYIVLVVGDDKSGKTSLIRVSSQLNHTNHTPVHTHATHTYLLSFLF
jgi:polynucleotide 5'-kinase involved in rRNA processing